MFAAAIATPMFDALTEQADEMARFHGRIPTKFWNVADAAIFRFATNIGFLNGTIWIKTQ
jgi:hypothetical protein